MQRCADADWAQRPAAVATRIALLDAAGDAAAAKELAEGALARSSGASSGKQPREDRAAAEGYLYQALAKLELKVCTGPGRCLLWQDGPQRSFKCVLAQLQCWITQVQLQLVT